MITRRMLVIVAALLCSATTFAQSNQLRQSATQLAAEATSFAEFSYNDYGRTFRNTGSVDAVMSAHQFSAAAQLFNRMVNDRRRNQDLNEAFQFLQNSWRSANRPDLQGRRNNIEGLMSRVAREINSGNDGPIPRPFPDQGGPGRGSGRMTWRGTVDDDVRIRVRGGTAEVETIGGTPYYDAVTDFGASMPPRRVNVSVVKIRGRGEVFVEQQPSRENDFTAIIRVRDSRGGASQYEFELSWQ